MDLLGVVAAVEPDFEGVPCFAVVLTVDASDLSDDAFLFSATGLLPAIAPAASLLSDTVALSFGSADFISPGSSSTAETGLSGLAGGMLLAPISKASSLLLASSI